MEGSTIADVTREHRSTLMFATPTFLLAYIRRAKREDFASLTHLPQLPLNIHQKDD